MIPIKKMKITFILFFLCIIVGCNSEQSENIRPISIQYNLPVNFLFSIPLKNSGEGLLSQSGDTIIFVDQNFCTAILISIKEKKSQKHTYFGLKDSIFFGHFIDAVCPLKNGGWVLRSNYNLWWINSNMKIYNTEKIKFFSTQTMEQLETNPNYMNPAIYEPDFTLPSMFSIDNSTIGLPIVAEHPLFNGFNTSAFYTKAKSLFIYRNSTPKKPQLIGNRDNIYLKQRFLSSFYSSMGYSIDNSNFLLGFEADSLITILDSKGKKIKSFGSSGRYMNNVYPTHNNLSFAFETETQKLERKTYGRYLQLIASNKGNHIARLYQRGISKDRINIAQFGIQYFKNQSIYADIDINTQVQLLSVNESDLLLGRVASDSITFYKIKFK